MKRIKRIFQWGKRIRKELPHIGFLKSILMAYEMYETINKPLKTSKKFIHYEN